VADIAEEAGVAHGLLYHYFRSKEELLETIFRETWRDVLDAVRSVEETDESARDRLAGIAKILLRAWRRDPDLVRVLVREVTRSSHVQRRVDEIDQAFAGLERIISRGQEEGEFRQDIDPRMVSYVFYGALEEILTGLVLGAEGIFALALSPVIGPWSDTFHTPLGRRRPFMLAALGPLGFCLLLMPFMPNLWTTTLIVLAFFFAYYVYEPPYRGLY